MESKITLVKSDGTGMEEALRQTELVAESYGLAHKDALHLRLLAEEMTGMLRAMTGEREANYWIDEKDGVFHLHLKTDTQMRYEKKEQLLSVASSGKNAAARGVMGKLRDIFETATMPGDDIAAANELVSYGLLAAGSPGSYWLGASLTSWSLNAYKENVEEHRADDADVQEAWDELEKSIVVKLADEVQVAIVGNSVEMVIFKKI